jgi:hypothetical protein
MKNVFATLMIILLMVLVLTSCTQDSVKTPTVIPLESQPENPGDGSSVEEPYPSPGQDQPTEVDLSGSEPEPYPEPLQSEPYEEIIMPSLEDHEYAPALGDEKLQRGNVFIDSMEILLLESYPVQVKLQLLGNLPTPCHKLRAIVSPPDDQKRIQVGVYALSDPGTMCTQVLEPFEISIPLGSFTEGVYTVWVNDESAGTFEMP